MQSTLVDACFLVFFFPSPFFCRCDLVPALQLPCALYSAKLHAQELQSELAELQRQLSVGQGQHGLLTARAREQKAWEIFLIEPQPNGKCNIRSTVGPQRLLSAEGGGGGLLRCNKTAPKGWEEFEIGHGADGTVTIRASNKQYLCAENGGGGNVVCNRKTAGGWETFRLNNLDYVAPAAAQYAPPQQQQQQQYYAVAPQQYATQGGPPQQYGYGQPQPPPGAYGQPYGQPGYPQQQYGQPVPGYGAPLAAGVQYAATGGAPPSPYANSPLANSGSAPPSPYAASPLTSSGNAPVPRTPSGPGGATGGPQDFVTINPGLDADTQAGHNHIGDFCVTIQALDKLMSDKLNPSSQKKSLMTLGRKGTGQITLSRDDKNAVLATEKKMLEEFNLFLFDWNKYSKFMSERDFNRVALLIGDFKDHLKDFSARMVKSETVKESTDKLLEKFTVVNIKFEQSISYTNSASSTANFSNQTNIEDHSQSYYEVPPQGNGN